jgi:hypothetical protein
VTWISLCQLLAFLGLLLAITKPLGRYMARVFAGERTFLSRPLLPLERLVYRLCAVNPAREQTWRTYAGCCLAFGLANFFLFYILLRCERFLPGHPAGGTPLTPDLQSARDRDSQRDSPPDTSLCICDNAYSMDATKILEELREEQTHIGECILALERQQHRRRNQDARRNDL